MTKNTQHASTTTDNQTTTTSTSKFLLPPIRLVTHNIRYAAPDLFGGERPWPVRAPHLIAHLHFLTASSPAPFICLQEVLHKQLTDILDGLNDSTTSATTSTPRWAALGVGRDDGRRAGEFCPILYQPRVWEPKEFRTLWLSATPDVPSRGWDAACRRVVTVGRFVYRGNGRASAREGLQIPTHTPMDEQTQTQVEEQTQLQTQSNGREVVVLCTHFDHVGHEARRKSAELICREIQRLQSGDARIPVLLGGDFNSEPTGAAYGVLNSEGSPVQDSRLLVGLLQRYGSEKTFTGFTEKEVMTRIDFVFVSKGSGLVVRSHAVLDNVVDGVYFSDHRAVVVDVQ